MKQLWLLLAIVAAVVVLWPYPVFYPLKLLVVFFHECSHALMTLATGGRVVELEVNAMQGGHVISAGGNRFLILSAGYLGSSLWGVLIYLLAVGSRLDKAVMVLLGLIIVAVCLLFIRAPFAFVFALAVAAVMVGVGVKASREINDFVLRVIGLTSMLYAPLDIYSDTIQRAGSRSDALMLAAEFGGTEVLWGGAWLGLSVAIALATVLIGLRLAPPGAGRARGTYSGWRDYGR